MLQRSGATIADLPKLLEFELGPKNSASQTFSLPNPEDQACT